MKKLAVVVLSLVLILVVLLSAVVLLSPAFLSKYKEPILERVSGSLNREITMGDIRLTLLKGFGLRLKDVTVANAEGFRQEPMLTMGGLDLRVKFLPLLRKELQVEKIILQNPRIVIEKDSKGVFNFSDLVDSGKPPEAGKEAGPREDSPGPGDLLAGLLVSQIMISDGGLTYYDASSPPLKDGVGLGNLNLSFEDVSLEKPIPFALSFGVNRDATDVKVKGVVGPVGKELVVDKVPLSVQAALTKFEMKRAIQFMEAPAFTIDEGTVSLNLDVSGDLGSGLKIAGTIDIDKLTLSDAAKKEMLVGLDTSVNVVGNLSGLLQDKMKARMDVTSPNLLVRLPKKSVAHGTRKTQFVQWLLPEAEAAKAKSTKSSRRKSSGGFEVEGKINIAKGSIGDIPFSNLTGNYSKKGDVVRVTDFVVKGFGPQGGASGNMTLNLGGKSPSYQVDLNATGIDLTTVQDTFTARREKVAGELNAKLNLSGVGFDSSSIQRSLKGGGDFKVTQGRLTNVNLEERILAALGQKYGIPVATVAQELGVEIAPGDETPFEEFFGIFRIGSGQIQVQDSSITSGNHGFSANGNVGLDEQLNLKAKMILRKVGDIKKKKFTYYLIDEKSRKYIPFRITGKSSTPKVMVDIEALVKGQARQAVEEQKEKVKEKLREKLGPEGEEILKPLEKIFKF